MSPEDDPYRNTRRRGDFLYAAATILMGWSLQKLGADSVPIIVVGLPLMFAHASVQSGIANKWGKKDDVT
ncbi:MAG: hypothetical protein KAI73_10640 [Rhodospirillaceae bacterium]|nr:hypothetical protein [Rhodospirillaceae bacterium]